MGVFDVEKLLSVREVAERCGVSARHIWKLVASGKFPRPSRLGRAVRWRAAAIDQFIAGGCELVEPVNRFAR